MHTQATRLADGGYTFGNWENCLNVEPKGEEFSMHNLWSLFSHLQANLDVLFAPEFNMPGEFKAGPGDVAKLVCREVDTNHD